MINEQVNEFITYSNFNFLSVSKDELRNLLRNTVTFLRRENHSEILIKNHNENNSDYVDFFRSKT
jgi:hypothetical protein